MVDRQSARARQQEADKRVSPKRHGIVVHKPQTWLTQERLTRLLREARQHVFKDMKHQLRFVSIRMAKSDDQAGLILLKIAQLGEDVLRREDLNSLKRERAF